MSRVPGTHRIKLAALAALDQRIGLRYGMPAMTGEETTSCLRHHAILPPWCRTSPRRPP
jgi:hypothetical protein